MTSQQLDKVHLSGAKETLLLTLGMRAHDSRSPHPVLGDRWAPQVLDRIDGYSHVKVWAFSRAERYPILLRSRQLDTWVRSFLARHPDATVLGLGCGLDSRAFRLDVPDTVQWYDVDFPEVVDLRRRLYPQRDNYHLVGSSVTEPGWLDQAPVTGSPVLVVAEGLFMYVEPADVRRVLARVTERFAHGEMVFDVMGIPQWVIGLAPWDMWSCPDPHALEWDNPRLTLLEREPAIAGYRRIPTPGWRAYYGLCNLFRTTRNYVLPLRFRFGPEEEM